MKTLDRYIIRQFLINFVILLSVLMLLFVLVDLIVDLDEFLQAGKRHADTYGSTAVATAVAVADYYGPLMILMYVFFSGLLVVGGMGFAIASLHRTRELTAIVASGISMYRIAAPVLLAGIALNALSIPVQELVIPKLASKLARSKSHVKYDASTVQSFPVRFAPDEDGDLIDAAEFDAGKGILTGVTILQRDERGMTQRRITASQAVWSEQPQGWKLLQGSAVQPIALVQTLDEPGALEPEPVEFFATEMSPTVLMARRASIYPRLLSLSELQTMQHNPAVEPRHRDQITRIVWSRFSMLVMNVLILVMGLSFFLQLGQQNMLMQAMKAAGVCLGAWGGGLMMLQVGGGPLNPVAAAWLPVVIYLPVSAILLQGIRT